jgi:MerR family transcriptional regulator, copper efflux regulator
VLPAGPRTEAGRWLYREPAVKRLTFIRRCQDFGFSIDLVRELVGLLDENQRPCVEVRDIASKHLAEVRKKLAELQALESSLSLFAIGCDIACAGGPVVDCTILEDLAHRSDAASLVTASPCRGAPLQNRVLAGEKRRIRIGALRRTDWGNRRPRTFAAPAASLLPTRIFGHESGTLF